MATLTELIANVGNTPKIRISGLKSDYLPETTHKDVLYFSIDSLELLFNGKIYGGDKIPIFTPEKITDESLENEFLTNGFLRDHGVLLYIPDLTNSEDRPSELILNLFPYDDSLYIFRRDTNEEDKAYFCLPGCVQGIGEEYDPEIIIQIFSLQLIDPERGIWLLIMGGDTIFTNILASEYFYYKDEVDTKISQKASASDVATLQGKVTTLETDNTNLKARVTALETDNTSLKSLVSELQSAIEDLYRIVTP